MEINGSHGVALRKESVDRNRKWVTSEVLPSMSLSARRAWIEIALRGTSKNIVPVALRKESVDRNLSNHFKFGNALGRSPQGERG